MFDIIVIGGGPAGLTAGLYGLRNGKSVVILEKSVFGGQITNSPKVENIPGFASISGDEWANVYLDQVMGQGAEVRFDEAVSVKPDAEGVFTVTTAGGDEITGRSVILATGTKHRTFGFDGEEELIGNGIHFCAVCDGDFYAGKNVVMIGGGNSALIEASILMEIAAKLTILQDLPRFTGEPGITEKVLAHPNVEAHVSTHVTGYEVTDGKLTGICYEENGQSHIAPCDGAFIAIGHIPDNKPFENVAELDKYGYFVSDENALTFTPGVFVAGDCRTKTLRQVATACSDGAMAAIAACKYLS